MSIEDKCTNYKVDIRKFYQGEYYCILGNDDCMFYNPVDIEGAVALCDRRTHKDILLAMEHTSPDLLFKYYKYPEKRYELK